MLEIDNNKVGHDDLDAMSNQNYLCLDVRVISNLNQFYFYMLAGLKRILSLTHQVQYTLAHLYPGAVYQIDRCKGDLMD